MNVAAIGAKIAGFPDCACSGHIINKIPGTMMLYHAITRLRGRRMRHHIQMERKNCRGLSQDMRMLGAVASWLEQNTRNVTTHPASPRDENHMVYSHGHIFLRIIMQRQHAVIINDKRVKRNNGVLHQGVGGKDAWPLSGRSSRVALTSLRPSGSTAPA